LLSVRDDLREKSLSSTGYDEMSAGRKVAIETRHTHSGAPEDLDIAVGFEPNAKFVAFQKPQPRPGRGLTQHILIDSSKIGHQLHDRPKHTYGRVGVVMDVVMVNNIVIPSCDGNGRVRDLKIMGVGQRSDCSSGWRRDTSDLCGFIRLTVDD
jgi:hypothetical protein